MGQGEYCPCPYSQCIMATHAHGLCLAGSPIILASRAASITILLWPSVRAIPAALANSCNNTWIVRRSRVILYLCRRSRNADTKRHRRPSFSVVYYGLRAVHTTADLSSNDCSTELTSLETPRVALHNPRPGQLHHGPVVLVYEIANPRGQWFSVMP